jgi:hypothetical protein
VLLLRRGPDFELEERSTAILIADRLARGVYKGGHVMVDEQYPWLSPQQLEDRQHREVFAESGFPDSSIVEGRVFRAYNPLFGQRP